MIRQEGTPACSLHIGTHNVNGALASVKERDACKIRSLVRLWCQLDLAIICVQETHLTKDTAGSCERIMNETAERIHRPGWVTWWSHHTRSSAGVGIIIRRDLVSSGVIKIRKNRAGRTDIDEEVAGRVIQLAVDWGGHKLNVGCMYLPSGDCLGQRTAITTHLGPLAVTCRSPIWAGDYNFVGNVDLDRIRGGG